MIDDGCGTTLNCGPCPTSQWTAIGSFSAEMRRVYQTPTAGVWIVDFDGNAYHTNDDSQFDTLKVQSMGGSEIFVLGGDVWLGGGDGISHKGSGDSSFTLLAGSPKNTGGLHGVAGGFFGTVANGTTGDLLRSTDGLTWSTITPSPAPMNMYAVFAASATEAFAVGAGGAIFHTTDGAHWQKQTSNFSGDLAAVWGSGSLMLAAGRTGTILRSTNQGVTWTKATSGITSDIFGIWGRSTSDIWASGAAATVLHSTDGGVTWSRETGLPLSSSTLVLFSVFETDGGKVYVVGQQGVIWVRTP